MKPMDRQTILLGILIAIVSFFSGVIALNFSNNYRQDYFLKFSNNENQTHQMHDGQQMPNNMLMNQNSQVTMGGMMMDMNANLRGKTGKDLEKAFLTEMIPHHQGAIEMAQLVLADKTITDTNITTLARNIVSAQNTEIAQMKEWLKVY